ncbi:MAG: class I SAM-dependent RNA methyltransferase [Acidobacteria bacterium]|nr:class I SAM-dependent RNA methyltransferase [Acidobacteriota bacterium]
MAPTMPAPGDLLTLTIEKPAAGGRMIARADGLVVLVAGAIPGERVRARIERVSKGIAWAQTSAIDDASPDRRDAGADPACGGCLYAHIAYRRQLAIKALVIADAFARIGRMSLPAAVDVASSAEEGYRMRARLHAQRGRLGFYREGTHQLCDPAQTRQLLPATLDVLRRIEAALHPLAAGALRELVLAENIDASERTIALDLATPVESSCLTPLTEIEGVTGLVAGETVVSGSPYVTDRVIVEGGADVLLRRHVLAFFQGSRYLFGDLIRHVSSRIGEASEVLDLYAGGGAFAVGVARTRGTRVTAVEGDPVAASDLMANAASAGETVTPVRASVEAFLDRARTRPQAAILDPPRTGLSREALAGLLRLAPPRIVYVSCDVPTLARDLRAMVERSYRVVEAQAFDLFPNTPHVETVVVLDRI